MAYGARVESVLGASTRGFESPILRAISTRNSRTLETFLEEMTLRIQEHFSERLRRLTKFAFVSQTLDRLLVFLFAITIWPYHWFSVYGGARYPKAQRSLRKRKVMVIPDHYYWPLINPTALTRPLDEVRDLPGIDFSSTGQTAFIEKLRTGYEIQSLGWTSNKTKGSAGVPQFSLNNGAFEAGDAEMLHHVLRELRPKTVLEIGSGHSTKIVAQALEMNQRESGESSTHICVEPFEKQWLERLPGVTVLRDKIERLDLELFEKLGPGDLLFIDSSHIIRPQGDVLWLYLHVLPLLKSGVVVHIHDFFSPRDYPKEWLFDKGLMWNEQYLVEALLTDTNRYKVLLALNYLFHSEFAILQKVCPHLTQMHNPGSLYITVA